MWELSTDQGARYISTWDEVEPLLAQMNNTTQAYLGLALEDGTRYIEIYGGHEGRVLVAFTNEVDDEEEVVLYDEKQTIPIMIYSMPDNEPWHDLPAACCVDKNLALRALKHFFDTGEHDETLDWRGWPNTD